MQTVAILTTSHNNREKILSVLSSCAVQIDKMKNDENFSFTIYLLDEQSTDGTVDSVATQFPLVKILLAEPKEERIHGLSRLWKMAAKEEPDFYLVLSPYIKMNEGAISCLIENSRFLKNKALIAGSISGKDGKCIYGGWNKHGKLLEPDEILPLPCYYFDGKLVLIPKYVYNTIGGINPIFTYRYADYDYGQRAHKQGINVVIAPKMLGCDNQDDIVPIWRNASYSLKGRYLALNSPEGCPPKDKFIFDLHRCGIFGAIAYNLPIWLKVLFPKRGTNK